MSLEVLDEFVYFRREERYLNLWRACVCGVGFELLDDLLLLCDLQHRRAFKPNDRLF